MNKRFRNIFVALILMMTIVVPGAIKADETGNEDFDISTGWVVEDFQCIGTFACSLGLDATELFMEGMKTEIDGKNYNSAGFNFANIGEHTFKATRTLHLEPGETYDLSLRYSLWMSQAGNPGKEGSATVNFNGKIYTLDQDPENKVILQKHEETIVVDSAEKERYTVTVEFHSYNNSSFGLGVGYYDNEGISKELNEYTVDFDSNGGSQVDSLSNVVEDTKINQPANPRKEGYSFVGWFSDSQLTSAWNFETDVVTSSITLFAKWEINTPPVVENKYTVIFDSNGGSQVEPILNLVENAKIQQPINPTKDGHDFVGWYSETQLVNAWNFTTDVVTSNTTLYAKWEVHESTQEPEQTDNPSVQPNEEKTEGKTVLPSTGISNIVENLGGMTALIGTALIVLKERLGNK